MFHTHNPIIGHWARQSAENLEAVFMFVTATIQQPIEQVPAILADYRENGPASKYAWGWKSEALRHYAAHRETIYADLMAIHEGVQEQAGREVALLAYLATLPGLGLVKGAFVAQLAFGVGGCMDSHNMKRFGANAGRFSASAFKALRTPEARITRIVEYCALVATVGGGAALWDSWCDYVASLRPDRFADGSEVSRLHVTAFGLAA
jgi:hypothetical protein